MKTVFTLLNILIFYLFSFSQAQLGLRLENYAGVSSLALNPAGNLSNPLTWDLNLAGGGLFLENNYIFVQQTSLPRLWKARKEANFFFAGDKEGTLHTSSFIFDYYNDNRKRWMNFQSFITGPSVAVKINDQHSFGIFTNVRAILSAERVSTEFSYYKYDQRPFFSSFQMPPFRGVMLSWSEAGLNYALKIPMHDGFGGIGINFRFLQGYEAAYLESLRTYQHTRLPDNQFVLNHPNLRFGYTSSNLQGEETFSLKRNGHGYALDLGGIIVLGEGEDTYRLKLGGALLDLGYLRFNRNAFDHQTNFTSADTLSLNDYKKYNELDQLDEVIQQFSSETLGDSLASFRSESFQLALPASLCLQGDYTLAGGLFINALLFQPLPTLKVSARQESLFALTPRFEHRWFSVSLPLSLANWQSFRAGLAARLGFLVVGTDDLLSLTGQKRWNGTDFYFALKFSPFDLGLWQKWGGNGRRHFGGKGKVRCYDF